MTTLYVLDVPENTGVAKVAAEDPAVSVGRIGPYFEITARGAITIDPIATPADTRATARLRCLTNQRVVIAVNGT